MTRRSTILVADDHPLVRDGIRAVLSAEADLTICGEADTAAAAVRRLVQEHVPDLVILDFDLLDGSSFDLLRELRSQPEPPRVLVLAGDHHEEGAAERALRLGASAFLSKKTSGAELLLIVRDVLSGRIILSDALIQRLIRVTNNRPANKKKTAARSEQQEVAK